MMLIYLLKANVILALLYAFYRLLFYRDTFFTCRRVTLLGIVALSLLAPLPLLAPLASGLLTAGVPLDIPTATVWLPEFVATPQAAQATLATGIADAFPLLAVAGWIYLAGVCLLLARIAVQLAAIFRLARRCPQTQVNGLTIHVLPEGEAPFSFFRHIFACPGAHRPDELKEILAHEQTHVRQEHSVDVMASELMCALCWFNPFAWLLKREIRQNLEYLADRRVLAEGHDKKNYQYHLLKLTYHKAAATIYNNFNVLPLKKRISMMNKKRTSNIGRLKYLLFLPVAILLAAACSGDNGQKTLLVKDKDGTRTVQVDEETLNKLTDTSNQPEKVGADNPDVYDMVEVRPMFPGGDAAMFEYLAANLKYPEEAKKTRIGGRVICQFVVTSEGQIGDVKVMRGVSPELDQEAVRVIKAMPAWTPGQHNGQAVSVRYTLPIMFELQ